MKNIILCGFKSGGKTTLAKKIAEKTGLHYIDTDHLVAKNPREFYLEVGEEAFREHERKVIVALAEFQNAVIDTGGGMVLDPANFAVFKKMGTLLYLRVPKEVLKERLLQDPLPAFIDPERPEESFERMYDSRKHLYETVADVIIDSEEQVWSIVELL